MINYYKSIGGKLCQTEENETGCWVNVIAPTEEEIIELICEFGLDPSYVNAALDEEETSRIEKGDGTTLIVLDAPMLEKADESITYYTIPLAIIATKSNVITISSCENPLFDSIIYEKNKDCNTELKTRFILQIMFKVATRFLNHLKQIDKFSSMIEMNLRKSMKNKELIQLLELQKSLVYFNTSLKSDEISIKKLASGRFIKLYEDDQELLDDVLIEVNQALEMASIHLNILAGTMDAFASVISNNLNIVMKILASLTIVVSIPTIIGSFYGMNVNFIPLPMFWFPVGLSVAVMLVVLLILRKKGML